MKSRITVLLGLVLMVTGLIWYAETLQESNDAERAVEKIAPQLQMLIEDSPILETQVTSAEQQKRLAEKVIDGVGYIGILSIPELSLELPIISFWSSENAKIAPCRYTGRVYENDLILCAHNYDSHFGKLDRLELGDIVEFTDMEGTVFLYQVSQSLILDGADMDGLRDGDWDLTLFTCTPGGKMRYCVRCKSTCQSR